MLRRVVTPTLGKLLTGVERKSRAGVKPTRMTRNGPCPTALTMRQRLNQTRASFETVLSYGIRITRPDGLAAHANDDHRHRSTAVECCGLRKLAADSDDTSVRLSRSRVKWLVRKTPSLARTVAVDASATCGHTHLLGHDDDFD